MKTFGSLAAGSKFIDSTGREYIKVNHYIAKHCICGPTLFTANEEVTPCAN